MVCLRLQGPERGFSDRLESHMGGGGAGRGEAEGRGGSSLPALSLVAAWQVTPPRGDLSR